MNHNHRMHAEGPIQVTEPERSCDLQKVTQQGGGRSGADSSSVLQSATLQTPDHS